LVGQYQPINQIQDAPRCLGIQPSRWLVYGQQRRVLGQCASERDREQVQLAQQQPAQADFGDAASWLAVGMGTRKLSDQARDSHSRTYSRGAVRNTQRTNRVGEANAVLLEVQRLVGPIVTISALLPDLQR